MSITRKKIRKKIIPFTLDSNKIYKPSQVKEVLNKTVNEYMLIGNNKSIRYYNVPCSFDIETTSFYVDENNNALTYNEKLERQKLIEDYEPIERCTMYIWQFGINGHIIIGRTWDELKIMLIEISEHLELSEKKRLLVYIHNFSYEFQFICKHLNWFIKKDGKPEMLNLEERKPLYALTDTFIEFRCSWLLSGYSLDNLSKNLLKYKVNKLVGDLDYSLMRHNETPLTQKELDYCINDIKVVMAYIQEEIENNKGIHNLPLTKTGRVRKYCRDRVFKIEGQKKKKNLKFISQIKNLVITSEKEFKTLQDAFMGGFTHANAYYVDELLEQVSSYDFTSSYPFVMVSEKFPMGSATKINIETKEDFETYINSCDNFLTVFDIEFINLRQYEAHETPLSISKCHVAEKVAQNNGRVSFASRIITTITNVDYEYLKKFYEFDSVNVFNVYAYSMDYLPTELIKCILDLYENKTVLKGVEGQEVNYMLSKEMINSVYGMCVTNPLRDEYLFMEDKWTTHQQNEEESADLLYKYNKSRNRFLFYPWGVFVTAYARRNLFTGILEFKNDYIYSDTDSIKVLNAEKHKEYFERYNSEVKEKLKKACEHHKIDFEKTQPKTKDGKVKPLGVWDYEGTYDYFKTLGAKRYMYSINDEVHITIAGLSKKEGADYLVKSANGETLEAFNVFKQYMEVPPENTGKKLHTYIDTEQHGELTDYLGNTCNYHELSSLHLEPTGYTLSLTKEFVDFFTGLKTEIE